MAAHWPSDVAPAGRRQLALAGLAIAGLAYVAAVDPHRRRLLAPRCPTKLITGLDCPACGGVRMTHDLLHGDLRAALHDNPFMLIAAPLMAGAAWRRWSRGDAGEVMEVSNESAMLIGGASLAWTIVRNLPRWPLKPTMRTV